MTEDLRAEKKAFRKKVNQLIAAQTPEQNLKASAAIMERIERLPEFQKAKVVMAFWSFKGEVHTHDFVRKWADRKQMLLPVVDGDDMLIKEYKDDSSMAEGSSFGIMEPVGALFTDYGKIDFIIVPGLAFDRDFNRLGRGKAYYDKFLSKVDSLKAAICFDFQFFDRVPADERDIRMDMVIAESFQNERSALRRS